MPLLGKMAGAVGNYNAHQVLQFYGLYICADECTYALMILARLRII